MLTKYDERQLLLMKQRIHSFEKTPPVLDALLSITRSLEGLLNSIEDIDKTWIDLFRTEWWELEFTSSVMMDRNVDELSEEDKQAVSEALKNMKNMIDTVLKEDIKS